jgi:hypothetical protein
LGFPYRQINAPKVYQKTFGALNGLAQEIGHGSAHLRSFKHTPVCSVDGFSAA